MFNNDYKFTDSHNNFTDCHSCNIQHKLLNSLKETEEYKRSHAIAEAINFLCNRIKSYDEYISELKSKQKEHEKKHKQNEEEKEKLKATNRKLEAECESIRSSLCLCKSKMETLEKLNSVLEAQIEETLRVEAQKREERTLHFNKILNEYKCTFDEMSEENLHLTRRVKELEEHRQRDEMRLSSKLKEVEESLNHLSEENKILRDNQLQYKTLPNSVENKEELVNFQFNTLENNTLTHSRTKSKGPSLEEIVDDIRMTENEIKQYTNELREQEISRLTMDENRLSFAELTNLIDIKTTYLFELKSKYNQLYKKVNLIN